MLATTIVSVGRRKSGAKHGWNATGHCLAKRATNSHLPAAATWGTGARWWRRGAAPSLGSVLAYESLRNYESTEWLCHCSLGSANRALWHRSMPWGGQTSAVVQICQEVHASLLRHSNTLRPLTKHAATGGTAARGLLADSLHLLADLGVDGKELAHTTVVRIGRHTGQCTRSRP